MANRHPKKPPPPPSACVNRPTKAIRLPSALIDSILEYAHALDEGKVKSFQSKNSILDSIVNAPYQELIELQKLLPNLILNSNPAKGIDEGILYLASITADWRTGDKRGFNPSYAKFGYHLAYLIKKRKNLPIHFLFYGYSYCQRGAKQLQRAKITYPSLEEVEAIVAAGLAITPYVDPEDKPPLRVELLENGLLAAYFPYDPSKIDQCKRIRGTWNASDRSMRFERQNIDLVVATFPENEGFVYYPEVTKELFNFKAREKLAQAAQAKIEQEKEQAKEKEALNRAKAIEKLVKTASLDAPLSNGWLLRDYQQEGIKWLLIHHRKGIHAGGILADDMGLGKTVQALCAARAMQSLVENLAILVIAPVSLMKNWQKEADLINVSISIYSWAKVPESPDDVPYLVIADEAHMAQSNTSLRTQRLKLLCRARKCIGTWLLTGTPIKNGRPLNLLPLLQIVEHPLVADEKLYKNRYCLDKGKSGDYSGAAHLDELSDKTKDVILRRTKKECLKELPAKTRLYRTVILDKERNSLYEAKVGELVADYRQRCEAGEADERAMALVTLGYLRKVGAEFKVPTAIELAEELLESGQSVVLFTGFVEPAQSLYANLGGELLTGDVKPQERQDMVDRFQAEESRVFISTFGSGGLGITLTAASNVILLDRPWTPSEAIQAEDRCHRLGQEDAVFSYWTQLGNIDMMIDNLLESKQKRIDLVLKGKRKTLKGTGDIRDLAKELLDLL